MTIASHTVVGSFSGVKCLAKAAGQAFAAGQALRPGLVLTAATAALLIFAGTAMAATTTSAAPAPAARSVLLAPSAAARFQQTVQQQQMRDDLQKAQVDARNRQGVSNNARVPHANNPQMQNQIKWADAAQQNSERARQQDIISRYQTTLPPLGRVVVPQTVPLKPASGGS